MRDVGVDERERLAGGDAPVELGEPLPLVRRDAAAGGGEALRPARAPEVAHASAASSSRAVRRDRSASGAVLEDDQRQAALGEQAPLLGHVPGVRVVAGADPGDDDLGARRPRPPVP